MAAEGGCSAQLTPFRAGKWRSSWSARGSHCTERVRHGDNPRISRMYQRTWRETEYRSRLSSGPNEEHITNGCGTNPPIYCPDELVTRGTDGVVHHAGTVQRDDELMVPTAPQVTGVSPNTMAATPGTQLSITITGINTNFQTGDTVPRPSRMLAVSNAKLYRELTTSISATLTANANVGDGTPDAVGNERRPRISCCHWRSR